MKQADVKIGGHYLTRCSGALVSVEVLREAETLGRYPGTRRMGYTTRRLDTGRTLTQRSAAALRVGCRCAVCRATSAAAAQATPAADPADPT